MDIQMNNVIMILTGPHFLYKGVHSSHSWTGAIQAAICHNNNNPAA